MRPLGGVLHLAGAEQEGLGLVVGVADELVGDLHAGLDDAVVGRGLADLGALEHVLELADPALVLALLLAGGVVAAVLLEVALVAGGADPGDDLLPDRALEVLQLGVELVVGLLGQPDGALARSAGSWVYSCLLGYVGESRRIVVGASSDAR